MPASFFGYNNLEQGIDLVPSHATDILERHQTLRLNRQGQVKNTDGGRIDDGYLACISIIQ